MLNIIKIENGFEMNENPYIFQDFLYEDQLVKYYIMSPTQVVVGTNQGNILLDLTVSIDGVFYNTLQEFIDKLYE